MEGYMESNGATQSRVVIGMADADARSDMEATLVGLGLAIASSAPDGAKALAAARLSAPDVVILDTRLSDGDFARVSEQLYCERIAPTIAVADSDDAARLSRDSRRHLA